MTEKTASDLNNNELTVLLLLTFISSYFIKDSIDAFITYYQPNYKHILKALVAGIFLTIVFLVSNHFNQTIP